METSKLTKQALSQLDKNNREQRIFSDDEFLMERESVKKPLETKKVGKETLDEKKSRKREVKEIRKVRFLLIRRWGWSEK